MPWDFFLIIRAFGVGNDLAALRLGDAIRGGWDTSCAGFHPPRTPPGFLAHHRGTLKIGIRGLRTPSASIRSMSRRTPPRQHRL